VVVILFVELVLVVAVFLPRPFRVACFIVVSALQVGIIATANYCFLNYLVLALGVLLLDDRELARIGFRFVNSIPRENTRRFRVARKLQAAALGFAFYATVAAFLLETSYPFLTAPASLLAPFRIANAYGLFAVMTEARYEIEFQGSRDGKTWVAYPFRYKPQNVLERPGFFAPYQPRFDWNLWFASLGSARDNPWVMLTQEKLLEGSAPVLALFRGDPFKGVPPKMVRTVLWQYWFTDLRTQSATGAWWRRKELGPYSVTLARAAGDSIGFTVVP
jgi:hypothetical protein